MRKILIIEDEELILISIKEFLTEEGYDCTTATNGIDGVKKAKGENPDLILCQDRRSKSITRPPVIVYH